VAIAHTPNGNINLTATIIDGQAIAAKIRTEIAAQVATLKAETGIVPGLAAVLVGDNPASHTYVRMKRKACEEVGIASFGWTLPIDTTQAELDALIDELNARNDVHGILVQLPLPPQLDEQKVLTAIKLEKDVDGFHPVNIGRLAMKGPEPLYVPATPAGVIRLLEETGVKFNGANAVVLGRSNIVGTPAAMLLLKKDCTVTICHSRTPDIPAVTRQADILVAAVGRPFMVKADWVKPGATVIDVGTTRIDDPAAPKGSRIVGDVDFDAVREVAGAITPVPKGVGPMTIAMLLSNTLLSAQRAAGK
jgi:methylenetetrahydrofolate dehydrogenase (NADP+) / methenyltetrahydrofolate cyclohydrolase